MRASSMHKLVTNSNGNTSSAMGGLFALIAFAVLVGLVVGLFS